MTNRNTSRSSDPVDTLAGYAGIGLFPLTFGFQPLPSDPDDLDAVHNHMKSMALRSPNKLIQQAKTVLDLMNSEVPSDILSQGDKDVDTNDNEIPRDRRPGLGRKRARFSLKPDLSQPTMSLEPILDVDKLKDPEEFFMAYERHENAKREIQKQMGGVSFDSDQQIPSTKPRQRRPGILGPNRRPAKYKHYNFSVYSDNNETPISSQEMLEQDVLSPTQGSQQEISNLNIASQLDDIDGSISKAENRVNGLLDELLSGSCKDLDGGGADALLQERLQIKPIVLQKLTLPDLQNIRRNDLKALNGNSPKPRKALVDMQNLLGGANCKLPVKDRPEAEFENLGSPTPPKNPFASLFALKKRTLQQSDPLTDQYSFSIIDTSPMKSSSPVDLVTKQSDLDDTRKDLYSSGELKSLMVEEDDDNVAEACSPKVTNGDSHELNGKSMDLEGHIGDSDIVARVVHKIISTPDADMDVRTDEVSAIQDNMQVGDVVSEPEAPAAEELQSTVDHMDQSSLAASEDRAIGGSPKSTDIGVEQQLEKKQEPFKKSKPGKKLKRKHPSQSQNLAESSMPCEQESQEASQESLNEQTEAKLIPRKERKRKEISRRQSLAGAGTRWDGGVRRSTRIKTRPLEYWKGERLLYGRIHDTMSTVIGMKYVSPAKDDRNPTVKVKHFVSDEYKELVEIAAWH